MKYFKLPTPVHIKFAHQNGKLLTKEGVVWYEAGDALVTGLEGESWPIRRNHFIDTYEAVPPLEFGQEGPYRKKYLPIEAKQIQKATKIELENERGVIHGEIGDWLLTAENGTCWVVSDSIFKATYHPMPEHQAHHLVQAK